MLDQANRNTRSRTARQQLGVQTVGGSSNSRQSRPQLSLQTRFSHYFAKPLLGSGPLIMGSLVITSLYLGWTNRDEGYLTAESGLGYWLGIVGSLMMLLLLLYPLRKRARFLRALGRVPTWFRSHMFLGILGPTLILFHANFRAGALNSAVALVLMLTIVASGIIGRYLYAKVHMGLYGSKVEIKRILDDADLMRHTLGADFPGADRLLVQLGEFEGQALGRRNGVMSSVWCFLTLGWTWQSVRRRVLRDAKAAIELEGKQHAWSRHLRRKQIALVKRHLSLYFAAVNKAARFGVYERLFALWHVLHMPLFILLVLSAILHVVAVHRY